jgi:hypothetical protein
MFDMQNSGVSLFTATVVVAVAYAAGFTHAITRRAYSDWQSNKGLMRIRRRLFFGGVFRLLQLGVVGLFIGGLIMVWVARDVRDGDRRTPLLPVRSPPGVTTTR